jgi:translation initiation factor IF-2
MEPDDFMKRGYLLPKGSIDLTEAWKKPSQPLPRSDTSDPVFSEIVIPEKITVEDLAVLLHQTKSQIIADLMKLGLFLTVSQTPDYETITKVALMHGYFAKRAA